MKELITHFWWLILLVGFLIGDWIRKELIIKKNKKTCLTQLAEIKELTLVHLVPFGVYYALKDKCFQVKALAENRVLIEELGTSFRKSSCYHTARWYRSETIPTALLSVGTTFKVIETTDSSGSTFSFQKGPDRKSW